MLIERCAIFHLDKVDLTSEYNLWPTQQYSSGRIFIKLARKRDHDSQGSILQQIWRLSNYIFSNAIRARTNLNEIWLTYQLFKAKKCK